MDKRQYTDYRELQVQRKYYEGEVARLTTLLNKLPQDLFAYFKEMGFPRVVYAGRVFFWDYEVPGDPSSGGLRFYSNRLDFRCEVPDATIEGNFKHHIQAFADYSDQCSGYLDTIYKIDAQLAPLADALIKDLRENGSIYSEGYLYTYGAKGVTWQAVHLVGV